MLVAQWFSVVDRTALQATEEGLNREDCFRAIKEANRGMKELTVAIVQRVYVVPERKWYKHASQAGRGSGDEDGTTVTTTTTATTTIWEYVDQQKPAPRFDLVTSIFELTNPWT